MNISLSLGPIIGPYLSSLAPNSSFTTSSEATALFSFSVPSESNSSSNILAANFSLDTSLASSVLLQEYTEKNASFNTSSFRNSSSELEREKALLYCLDRPFVDSTYITQEFVKTRAALDLILVLIVVFLNSSLILAIHLFRFKNRGTAKVWNSGTSMKFVLMLALSDVLVGLATPLYMVPHYFCYINDWMRGNLALCMVKYVGTTFAALMSNVSLINIAVDRLIAIQYNIKYRIIMTHRLCHLMIAGQVLFCTVTSGVLFFWNKWTPDTYCDLEDVMPLVYILSLGCFVHGFILLTVAGVHIQLHRVASGSSRTRANSTVELRMSRETKNSIKSAKVVVLVAGVYFCCWTPYVIIIMVRIAQDGKDPLTEFVMQFFVPITILHSLLNPFIYAWKNSEIQSAVIWSLRRASQ